MDSKRHESKKQYAKPEVAKHGNVEELTKFVVAGGSSSPVQLPPSFSFPFSFPFFLRT